MVDVAPVHAPSLWLFLCATQLRNDNGPCLLRFGFAGMGGEGVDGDILGNIAPWLQDRLRRLHPQHCQGKAATRLHQSNHGFYSTLMSFMGLELLNRPLLLDQSICRSSPSLLLMAPLALSFAYRCCPSPPALLGILQSDNSASSCRHLLTMLMPMALIWQDWADGFLVPYNNK